MALCKSASWLIQATHDERWEWEWNKIYPRRRRKATTKGATKCEIASIISKWTNSQLLAAQGRPRTLRLAEEWTVHRWTTWNSPTGNFNLFIHLRVGRRDRRMEHMLRCGCERYQIYSAMIGCNEINFYGKFIDTAEIESKRNLEARVQQQHMEGGRRTSSLHQFNLNPK